MQASDPESFSEPLESVSVRSDNPVLGEVGLKGQRKRLSVGHRECTTDTGSASRKPRRPVAAPIENWSPGSGRCRTPSAAPSARASSSAASRNGRREEGHRLRSTLAGCQEWENGGRCAVAIPGDRTHRELWVNSKATRTRVGYQKRYRRQRLERVGRRERVHSCEWSSVASGWVPFPQEPTQTTGRAHELPFLPLTHAVIATSKRPNMGLQSTHGGTRLQRRHSPTGELGNDSAIIRCTWARAGVPMFRMWNRSRGI